MVRRISKVKSEEVKERFINGAWIAHQMGAGGDKNFGDYLKEMGLLEGTVEAQPKPQRSAEQIIKGANKTLEMLKKKQDEGKE